ncbi:hypothetical protein TrST_g7691 [Triparma strigata]|nr:hypothetical protein TrST_g7691 [Triparma strigata]
MKVERIERFLLKTLTITSLILLTSAQPGRGPTPDIQPVISSCQTDVLSLCGGSVVISGVPAIRKCLEDAYNGHDIGGLSETCQDALNEYYSNIDPEDLPELPDLPVPGGGGGNQQGCFHDIATLCPKNQRNSLETMTQCLNEHYEELSDGCKDSIDNKKNARHHIPSHFLQSENKDVTKAIIAVSIVVLLIPLVWSMLAFKRSRKIFEAMYDPFVFSAKSGSAVNGTHHHPELKLSFYQLSYHIGKKRILNDVSVAFLPGSLTAIMGPSGSGKTTLLNLISGHASVGNFEGSRIVNGIPYGKQEYDNIIRSQGYVEQDDNLLFDTLTVWETLSFASLLRLPEKLTVQDKFRRALEVLEEVGLAEHADAPVGGVSFKGISGGQRRRLSIAIELLRSPGCLILDEPTSGLDATTSLQLIQSLKSLASKHNRTVITTIHQPRAEIFDMFNNVVLLGKGGGVVYSGDREFAATYLNNFSSLNLQSYDNPADFVIDAMGLSDTNNSSTRERKRSNEKGVVGVKKLVNKVKDRARKTKNERAGYGIVGVEDCEDGEDDGGDGVSAHEALHSSTAASTTSTSLIEQYSTSEYARAVDNVIKEQCLNPTETERSIPSLSVSSQTTYLFARRYMRLNDDPGKTMKGWFSMGVMGGVISYAFSYSSQTPPSMNVNPKDELEKPYQTFMLLLMISSVAMIMEYLILVPEYMSERKIFLNERKRHIVSNRPYVIACMLTEVPRGVLHASILILVGYMFHSMNPDSTNIVFCVVTLMCGCVSWQSVICLVSCMFNEENYVYNMLFLVLGGGTLFGGLLIKLPNIPKLFTPIYYISVPAITQRALVVNDFLCCYLSATCDASGTVGGFSYNYTEASFFGNEQCPAALEFAGDGSDEGNLGRLALRVIGLDNVDPFIELSSIFSIAVASRMMAVVVLRIVERRREGLKEVNVDGSQQRLRGLLGEEGGGAGGYDGGDEEGIQMSVMSSNNDSSFTI